MNCYLLINPNVHSQKDFDVICPFCNFFDNTCSLQYDDYVENPMIWCNSCNCRSFLNISIELLKNLLDCEPKYKKINREDIIIDETKKSTDLNLFLNNEKTLCYEIPLLKIKSVTPSNLHGYFSKNKLSYLQIEEFLNSETTINYEKKFDEKIMEKYDIIFSEEKQDENLFLLLIHCDSYDVETPQNPYPNNFDTSHDGSIVECILENDNIVKYWGD